MGQYSRKKVDFILLNEMRNLETFRKWLSRQFRLVGNKTWTGDLTNFEVFAIVAFMLIESTLSSPEVNFTWLRSWNWIYNWPHRSFPTFHFPSPKMLPRWLINMTHAYFSHVMKYWKSSTRHSKFYFWVFWGWWTRFVPTCWIHSKWISFTKSTKSTF